MVFTGLVRRVGVLAAAIEQEQGRELVVEAELAAPDRILGASVAINGVCLTVTGGSGGRVHFEAAFETLRKTTLGALRPGARLNVEPALRVGDALGGHWVSGHVDGVATLRSVQARGAAKEFCIEVPQELAAFIAPKGSATLEGVSLTVNDVDGARFMVGVIPHTLEHTTLGRLVVGAGLNLEVDLLARYVARMLDVRASGRGHAAPTVTAALLERSGFGKQR